MDYKAIRAAIDYVKKPIPDVIIKNDKGGLFSKDCFTLVSSSKKKEIGDTSILKLAELKKHCMIESGNLVYGTRDRNFLIIWRN